MTLADRLQATGLSLNQMAKATGWDRSAVARAVRGEGTVSHQVVLDIWQALGYRLEPVPDSNVLPLTLNGLRAAIGRKGP